MNVSRFIIHSAVRTLVRKIPSPILNNMLLPTIWLSTSFNQKRLYNASPISLSSRQNQSNNHSSNSQAVVANQDIKAPKMRVVFTDPATNSQKHEILDREKALQLAKSHDLDLILVSPDANPPVCKLGKVSAVVSELKKKEKEKRQQQKNQSMKEMIMTVGIDKHDFETKMTKVKSFLKDGHPVKVTLFSKRRAFSKAAIAKLHRNTVTTSISDLDDATLHVLTSLEDMNVTAPQISDHHSDVLCPPGIEGSYVTATGQTKVRVHQRREFQISPKSGSKASESSKK